MVTINWRIFTNVESYPALEIIAACLVSGYLLVIRAFTFDRLEKRIYLTVAVVFSLYPYYVIIDQFNIPIS